jgi:hypothetical protein
MGNRLVRAAILNADAALSDRARLVLIRMSLQVLDKQQGDQAAAEYWGGWQWLVLPYDDGTRSAASLERMAMRALAELTSKGYIKPTGRAANHGHRQRYLITLDY